MDSLLTEGMRPEGNADLKRRKCFSIEMPTQKGEEVREADRHEKIEELFRQD